MTGITVRLHGNLRRFLPAGEERINLSLADAPTVAVLLARLALPAGEIAMTGVNGKLAESTQRLVAGDQIDIFAPVAGGRIL